MKMPKSRPPARGPVFVKCDGKGAPEGLLAILLDAGGAQAGEAVLIDGKLPGQELVHGQGIAAAGFLKGKKTAADGGDDLGLAADHPPFGSGRGKIAIVNGLPSGPMTYFTLGRWGSVMVYSQTQLLNA